MRIARTVFLVFLAAMMIFCVQSIALAAEKPILPEYAEFPYKTGEDASNSYGLVIQNYNEKTTIKKLKSSDPSVIKASWSKKMGDCIDVTCLKPGTSTISGVLYDHSKKVGTFKIKAVVYQYESPVKTFKLGSKNYASEFQDKDQYYLTITKTEKFKVTIKPNKGWKLNFIEFYDGTNVKDIKNNSKVTCKNSWNYVNAHFYNEKLGKSESTVIYIQKDE